MLTRDLIRTRDSGDRVEPLLAKATPAVLATAESVLELWREHVGKTQRELDEAAPAVVYRARSLVFARGLNKVIADRVQYREPKDVAEDRWSILRASAAALQAGAPLDVAAHRAAIAEQTGIAEPEEQLYADLPHATRIEGVPEWTAEHLLARYNLALIQGLLLGARTLRIESGDRDVGRQRLVLKALRWHRLLADVNLRDERLVLEVSGPGAVLDQGSRYGLQLAQFFPAVCELSDWQLSARIKVGKERSLRLLELNHELGLRGHTRFTGHVPEELLNLREKLEAKEPQWTIGEQPPLMPLPNGEVLVPDMEVRLPQGPGILVELFHRWHRAPLQRRLEQLAARTAPNLIIGVDRSLARLKDVAALLDQPIFAERGFLFSGFPSPTALRQAVNRQLAARE